MKTAGIFITLLVSAMVGGFAGTLNLTASGKTPITRDLSGQGINWGGDGKSLVLFTARDRGGMTEVCGAMLSDGNSMIRALEPKVLDVGWVSLDGTILANTLHFLERLRIRAPAPIATGQAIRAFTGNLLVGNVFETLRR